MIRATKKLTEAGVKEAIGWSACMLQLAVEFESNNYVEEFVDYLDRSVLGLHLHLDGNNLVSTYDQISIQKLPSYVNSLSEASLFCYENLTPRGVESLKKGFSVVAVGDRKVVLHIPHELGDGGYFKFLIHDFLKNSMKISPHISQNFQKVSQINSSKSASNCCSNFPPFPISPHDVFANEIQKAPVGHLLLDDPDISRIIPHDHPQGGNKSNFLAFSITPSQMKAYNQSKNGKLSNFSELQWLSLYLAGCAHDGKIYDHAGIASCMDMRGYLKNKPTLGHCLFISSLTNRVDNISPNMSLFDVGRKLRQSFQERLSLGKHFSFIKAGSPGVKHEFLKGRPLEISNVGAFNIRHPISDVYISLHTDDFPDHTHITLTGFSRQKYDTNGKAEGENKIHFRMMYNPNQIGGREMEAFGRTVEHNLQNLTFGQTVGDAYETARRFYQYIY
ncbi:hypothetical protein TRFO_38896 [Tritrichomonas foetus]|uniref:Uncharacterized protein n=1 Tax=Tritrichomonas foetus TaxID=1144522 RepID=A0A1J4J9N8_9EUKA|nr:hypothetical protein TRFO_38896 [Tritrichomonas foetus]|eukprot:OHS94943.1 hypothetical protein TRFO_38896 [Tritrichomonas foetus]